MRFIIDDKHLIKWMWVKKIRRKTLAQDDFDRSWSFDGSSISSSVEQSQWSKNISARSLTLLIFAVGWALCGRPQPEHESVMPLLHTFSDKCFNPWKLYPVSGNSFRKWFASYFLFIHKYLIIMWSPTINLIAVTTLLMISGLHRC